MTDNLPFSADRNEVLNRLITEVGSRAHVSPYIYNLSDITSVVNNHISTIPPLILPIANGSHRQTIILDIQRRKLIFYDPIEAHPTIQHNTLKTLVELKNWLYEEKGLSVKLTTSNTGDTSSNLQDIDQYTCGLLGNAFTIDYLDSPDVNEIYREERLRKRLSSRNCSFVDIAKKLCSEGCSLGHDQNECIPVKDKLLNEDIIRLYAANFPNRNFKREPGTSETTDGEISGTETSSGSESSVWAFPIMINYWDF